MKYFTPIQSLLNNSKRHPDKVFLHQPINREWHTFTWQQVELQARKIAAGLKAKNFPQGSRIGILSKNCAHWIIADLAIMMAGMISVPIYATAKQKTISYVAMHADLQAIFVGKLDSLDDAEKAIPDSVLRIAFPFPTVSASENFNRLLEENEPLQELHQPDIDDMATIVYTSGSTGNPKGVVLTYKNWVSAAQYSADALNITSEDRGLSYLPMAHIVERSLEAVALFVGSQVYFAESLDTFIEDLQYAKPTMFGSVPRLWLKFQSNILAKMPQKKLDFLLAIPFINKIVKTKIRTALGLQCADRFASGTAPIPKSLLQWYENIDINISEGWGMTETSSMSCVNYPYSKEQVGTIGSPMDCVEMKLSEQNEILIKGDAVFTEYYLDPKTTNESFEDGWFKTGDVGNCPSPNVFQIVGRVKDKFKTSKGKYVTPVPIESLLSASPLIEQTCVMGTGLKQPIAIVELGENINRADASVQQELSNDLVNINAKLEKHEKLDYLVICKEAWTIDNGLLTPTLKIKRNLIEDKYASLLGSDQINTVILEENII